MQLLNNITFLEFFFIYTFMCLVFSLGVVVGLVKNRQKQRDSLSIDEVAELIKKSFKVPEVDSTAPEADKPIVDVKLGAVRRPDAEKLWRRDHPGEAAEMDEVRAGIQRVIDKEQKG